LSEFLTAEQSERLFAEKVSTVPSAPPQPQTPKIETERLKEARVFLDDSRKFFAQQKSVPSIEAIAKEAANIQKSIDNFDEPAAVRSMKNLSDLLKLVAGYDEFERQSASREASQ